MNNIEYVKNRIRKIIANSSIPEDPLHAENTLEWLLKLDPFADEALQIAALVHDIDRALENKVQRSDFNNFDDFKQAHASNSAKFLRTILEQYKVENSIAKEAGRLVELHEVGGDPRSDLLKDADSISFFDVNLPYYFKREGWQESKRRAIWGYQRLSKQRQNVLKRLNYNNAQLTKLKNWIIKNC